ncbi:Excinuclease ABC subunit C [Minicystis rosea]|nr:Excinuclease ABC subunit C [Minicystis rosea]
MDGARSRADADLGDDASRLRFASLDPRRPSTAEEIAAMRAAVRAGAADRPGVYRMIAADGEVLYVGKSKRIRTRLLSYFRCDEAEKGARILRRACRIDWEYAPSEFAALLRELGAIQDQRPRFNVVSKREARHYAFVRITRGPAPKLQVVRGAPASARVCYGPFVGAGHLADAVRRLSDALGLRDCAETVPLHFEDQRELISLGPRTPGCHRYEIKRCLGPCVGGSARAYAERVDLARAFLEGEDDRLLETLRRDMEVASASLAFERASALRDRLQRLSGLRAQFDTLRMATQSLTFLYPVAGFAEEDRVYLIQRGSVRADLPAPRSEAEAAALRDRIHALAAVPHRAHAPMAPRDLDQLLLVAAWFRKHPEELLRTRPLDPASVSSLR